MNSCTSQAEVQIPYFVTEKFIDEVVLPYAEVLPLGLNEYRASIEAMGEAHLKPSDALHIASMMLNGVTTIASEDRGLDATSNVNGIWLTESSTNL